MIGGFNMITEDYVFFETAKLLKEKGFDEDIARVVNEEGEIDYLGSFQPSLAYLHHTWYRCPTIQMAMKWLREVHNIFIDISSRFSKNADKDVCFSYSCKKLIDTYKSSYEIGDGEWLNYEEACEAAIKYCLKNLI